MIDQLPPRYVQRRRFTVTPNDGNHQPLEPAVWVGLVESFDKHAVADLTVGDINGMSRNLLVKVIRGADFPALFRTDLDEHLEFVNLETLRRLAFLARQCCRNQGY